jgi:uncharacterized protein YbcI
MMSVVTNRAEIEYAVMLAVLNFQTEFMKSNYSRVQVHVCNELIEVTLTRTASIPAEDELARSTGGRALLRQFYQTLFDSCQSFLCQRIESAIGVKVQSLIADCDPPGGRTALIIRLHAPLAASSSCQ